MVIAPFLYIVTSMDRENHSLDAQYRWRRELVFLVLSGLFLGTLAMLNILGISRFIDFSFEISRTSIPFIVAVGVLPYPVTFLVTDLVSELYGKKRANALVFTGLLLNLWIVFIIWLGGILPPQPELMSDGLPAAGTHGRVFFEIRMLTFGAVAASMIAYLSAQFIDVYLFHFYKKLTKGKHLWLRNNGSTMISQLVDTVAVILITHYYANALPIKESEPVAAQLMVFILSGYVFKFTAALIDTIPFYYSVKKLRGFLNLKPDETITGIM